MAISIIDQPKNPNTAFNPNRWVIDSTNKLQPGFRYTVQLIDNDTTLTIKEIIVAPRPDDGYGEFDLSKLLSDQLSINSLDFSTLTTTHLLQSNTFKLNYKLTFGEKYIVNWPYTDTEYVSGDLTKCVQDPVTSAHAFIPGDSVVIVPTTPSIRPTFQGLYNVIALENVTNFPIFNTPWVSTGLNPGIIRYADNRPNHFTGLLTTSVKTVFKSAKPTFDWPDSLLTAYQLGNNTKQFFTNFQDNFYINPTQDLYWPIEYDEAVTVKYQRNDGATFTKTIANRTSAKYIRYINVAAKSNYTTGTGSLFTDDIKYYDVWIETDGPVQLSKKYRINVNHNCKSSDIEILFEDRMGGFSSFAFDALYQYNISVTKDQFNQPILMSGSTYDENNIQGTTNITIDFDKEFTLRTRGIQNRTQDQYYEELLSSGNTWIKINGAYQRVDILTTNDTFKSIKQTGLRRRELRVRLANKNLSNY